MAFGSGSATAGTWFLIILVVLFFSYIYATTTVGVSTSTVGLFNGTIYSADYTNIFGPNATASGGYCSDPRYFINAQGTRQTFTISTSSLDCQQLYAFNQTQCQAIPDCSWQSVTSGFWWWQTSNFTCTGYINVSFLSMGNESYSSSSLFGFGEFLQSNQSPGLIGTSAGGTSVCNSPRAQTGLSMCQQLGCTWTSQQLSEMTTDSSFSSIINFMFSWNPTISGLPATLQSIYVFINWTFIFALVVAGVMFIRG